MDMGFCQQSVDRWRPQNFGSLSTGKSAYYRARKGIAHEDKNAAKQFIKVNVVSISTQYVFAKMTPGSSAASCYVLST